jgi:hypothetical protein
LLHEETEMMGRLTLGLGIVPRLSLAALVAVGWIALISDTAAGSELDVFFSEVPHAAFEWSGAEGVSDRGAILVPVALDGVKGWLQLDTGLDATKIYGDLGTDAGWEERDGFYRVPRVRIGEMDLRSRWLLSDSDMPVSNGVLGSIGLDLLVGHVVVIDYPGQRFALASLGDMPGQFLDRISWAPATLRDGKFFPHVAVGGTGAVDLFFDTGASAFGLVVDESTWRELTGVTDPDSAAIRWTVSSWGNEVDVVGHPASGPLVVGSARLEGLDVFYFEDRPRLFEGWPFETRGLIGNSGFFDRVVVLDLGLRARFGLFDAGARPD